MDVTDTAHRGFAGVVPENTRAAARFARERADRIELDVRPCGDGTPVVFHDERLDRRGDGSPGLTDGAGAVSDTPLGDVESAVVLESGETVPTLSSYLDAAAGAPLNVELKSHGGEVRPGVRLSGAALAEETGAWGPFVDRVLEELDGYSGEVLFSSFCHAALAAVRERDDRPLAAVATEADVGLDVARALDAGAVHPRLDCVVDTPFYAGDGEPDVVAAAHAEDRLVRAWTVTIWHEAARLVDAGVDGLITEYPGLRAFGEHG